MRVFLLLALLVGCVSAVKLDFTWEELDAAKEVVNSQCSISNGMRYTSGGGCFDPVAIWCDACSRLPCLNHGTCVNTPPDLSGCPNRVPGRSSSLPFFLCTCADERYNENNQCATLYPKTDDDAAGVVEKLQMAQKLFLELDITNPAVTNRHSLAVNIGKLYEVDHTRINITSVEPGSVVVLFFIVGDNKDPSNELAIGAASLNIQNATSKFTKR